MEPAQVSGISTHHSFNELLQSSSPRSMAPLFHMEALLPSSISPKIESILQSHIYPQVGHVFRALAKFKALLVDVLSKKRTPRGGGGYHTTSYHSWSSAKSSRKSKMASFVKLQFHWAAGSSAQQAERDLDVNRVRSCFDSTWNVVVPADDEEVRGGGGDMDECGYLCWLEEERSGDDAPAAGEGEDGGDGDGSNAVNEIDRLAEKFIAGFHAKFLLEKQESYRRYQEMMARSV